MTDDDRILAHGVCKSRRVARILLAYRDEPRFFAEGQALGLHHQTVQRCVEKAVAHGPFAGACQDFHVWPGLLNIFSSLPL